MRSFLAAHPHPTTMTRSTSLLALALALSACANDTAPSASEQPGSAAAPVAETPDAAAAVDPPAAAVAAFQSAHAGATDLAWSREDSGDYEASFTEGGEQMSIVYATDGTPGAVETEIAVADLPAAVTATLARDYAGKTVNEAARIVSGGQTTYEAEITEDGKPRDLVFNTDGKLAASMAAEAD